MRNVPTWPVAPITTTRVMTSPQKQSVADAAVHGEGGVGDELGPVCVAALGQCIGGDGHRLAVDVLEPGPVEGGLDDARRPVEADEVERRIAEHVHGVA